MVSPLPNWEATPAPPAIVQEAEARSQEASDLVPPAAPQPNASQLEAARNRVQQHLQQIVQANRARQQAKPTVAPSPVIPIPQPIPTPSPVAPSIQATQREASGRSVPSIQKSQSPKAAPPASPVALSIAPGATATQSPSADLIPFIPESIEVVPITPENFCSTVPESHPKPSFLNSIAQLSAGIANFLHIPTPPSRKPQGQAIDLRTLKGSPADCHGAGKLGFPLASPAPITSGFGWRTHPVLGTDRMHWGLDFGSAYGTIVRAAQSGTIVAAGDNGDGYGGKVVIQSSDNMERTLYAHLSSVAVRPGDRIVQGQAIGRVGSTGLSTGPHLHFEVQVPSATGEWQAIDPFRRS